ncbi:MAG: AAA family ATPase [Calditrichaeota bacterium]|nr:MAG: AAA family ATPase [Calditrichota bacterium]
MYDSSGEAIGGVVSFRSCKQNMFADGEPACSFHGIVGKSRRMLDIFQIIREVADSKATVLILGESGTGKELVANAIQKLSSRCHRPYVKVNCAAIPDTLLESELFGHVKGAFTDAHADRVGRFALADGGTIFLDEVGDLTPPAQLRLLRVLEQGEFQRLGSSETIRVDVRVIAATNHNLWQLVQEGRFRDDLFYRLNVIPITLPPLAQRREDLPLLIEHFMEKYRRLTGKPIYDISDKANDLLMAYAYPGNVRELENIIEHAFARTDSSVITENKLPFYLRSDSDARLTAEGAAVDSVSEERSRILSVLQRHHWNRVRAARALGWSRTTLWRRMRQFDLLERSEQRGATVK